MNKHNLDTSLVIPVRIIFEFISSTCNPARGKTRNLVRIKKGRTTQKNKNINKRKNAVPLILMNVNESWQMVYTIHISICLSVSVILILSFSHSTIIYCWWWAFCSKIWTWGGISGANKSVKAILYCRYLCRNQLFTLFSSI